MSVGDGAERGVWKIRSRRRVKGISFKLTMKSRNIRGMQSSSSGSKVYEAKLGCVVADLRPWGVAKFEIGAVGVKEPS